MTTNCLINIDLYLTLKNPFYPREKRVLKYYIILIATLVYSVVSEVYPRNETFFKWYIVFLFSIIFIPGILVIAKLCRKGTSKELRHLVIRRHLIFVAISTYTFGLILGQKYGVISVVEGYPAMAID